jgi:heme/copper-type cytochrome/quinol oxidase subunit 1
LSTLGAGGLLVASTFSAGHVHTFVAGGVLFAFMAGLPSALAAPPDAATPTGPGAAEPPGGRVAALLAFAGASLAFLPMFAAGLSGMPRRMGEAMAAHPGLHGLAFLGGLTLAAGLALAVFGFWRMTARRVAHPLLRH